MKTQYIIVLAKNITGVALGIITLIISTWSSIQGGKLSGLSIDSWGVVLYPAMIGGAALSLLLCILVTSFALSSKIQWFLQYTVILIPTPVFIFLLSYSFHKLFLYIN